MLGKYYREIALFVMAVMVALLFVALHFAEPVDAHHGDPSDQTTATDCKILAEHHRLAAEEAGERGDYEAAEYHREQWSMYDNRADRRHVDDCSLTGDASASTPGPSVGIFMTVALSSLYYVARK